MIRKTVIGAACALAVVVGALGPGASVASARVRFYGGSPAYQSPCWQWSYYQRRWVWACRPYPVYPAYPYYRPYPFFEFGFGFGHHHHHHHR